MTNPEVFKRKPGYDNGMMLEDLCRSLYVLNKNRAPEKIKKQFKNSIIHYMKREFKFRDYQKEIIEQGSEVIREHGFVYLSMQVRTGKTLTSLGIADKLKKDSLVFLTKKKAISSVEADIKTFGCSYKTDVVNYESMHKLEIDNCDILVVDEAHSLGAFPKPSKRAKDVKKFIQDYECDVILMSGTPTPESYSQMYHQVFGIPTNPFSNYKNFYRFCDDYVNVKTNIINSMPIKDYSGGKDSILEQMEPFMISYTQEQAGFESKIEEEILTVSMSDMTKKIISKLRKDRVVEGKKGVILGDTPVKLMSKEHQLSSGTVKIELHDCDKTESVVIDTSKAEFIKKHFKGKKIGIFYKFKAEWEMLKSVFGDSLCNEIAEFDKTDKNIALQIVSGREGISLKKADCLVYVNIDFSATSYWQSRDRMTTKERTHNKVYWIFSENGIEHDIYKQVINKKDFTLSHYKQLIK